MGVIYVIRPLGGTLILNVTPPVPRVVTPNATVDVRSGQATAYVRSGVSTVYVRKD